MHWEIVGSGALPAYKSRLGLRHGPAAVTEPPAAHFGIQWRHLVIVCSVHRKQLNVSNQV